MSVCVCVFTVGRNSNNIQGSKEHRNTIALRKVEGHQKSDLKNGGKWTSERENDPYTASNKGV